jgi:hypothetical protein
MQIHVHGSPSVSIHCIVTFKPKVKLPDDSYIRSGNMREAVQGKPVIVRDTPDFVRALNEATEVKIA